MTNELKKLSKSIGPVVYYKAQVFKAGSQWVYACQEGCINKIVPGAGADLMLRIAQSHMQKTHKPNEYGVAFVRSRINGG